MGTSFSRGIQESGLAVHPSLPEHDPEARYKMDACPRGLCVIIVNYEFHNETPLRGHTKDRDSLKSLFEELHFNVIIRDNVTATQMYATMKDVSNIDHASYDCLVTCIMSHGANGCVLGADGNKVGINDITALFSAENCPSLAGKPKMFFIQACRGSNRNYGVATQEDEVQILVVEEKLYVPKETDLLLGFATLPNYVTWIKDDKGGWYIQALVEGLHKWADRYDLLAILTWVSNSVSKRQHLERDQIVMQAPEHISSLRKKVFFLRLNRGRRV